MNKWYTEYSEFLRRLFPEHKMQKISVNAGFSCPNRDGTVGTGGCIYCNNSTFSPAYCNGDSSVSAQLEAGRAFFGNKYPDMCYLAYFQSYTSTYGDTGRLEEIFCEALGTPGIEGLVVGTRPDCIDTDILSLLSSLNQDNGRIIVEYGVESMHDKTLRLINRHHDAQCAENAIVRTSEAGIACGIHLIMGLPGETEADMLDTVRKISSLPVDTVKFHQLQVVRNTPLADIYRRQQNNGDCGYPLVTPFSLDSYIKLCAKIVRVLPRRIAIERFTAQSPANLLIAPSWGIKNYQFVHLLHKELEAGRYNSEL